MQMNESKVLEALDVRVRSGLVRVLDVLIFRVFFYRKILNLNFWFMEFEFNCFC